MIIKMRFIRGALQAVIPTIAISWQASSSCSSPQVQESNSSLSPQGWMSNMIFSILQNSKEVGSSASEGMSLPASRQGASTSFIHVLHSGCPKKVWPRLMASLLTTYESINKNPSHVYPVAWTLVNSRCNNQLMTKNSHHVVFSFAL